MTCAATGAERIYTAAVVVIGNEVLSGRIQDANLCFLARELKTAGIRLREARVIPDVVEIIVATVGELRHRHDYLFTTGGIGPTHDDVTADAIARVFDVPLERNPVAERILREHYGDEINDARLRMADVPRGATLLDNPISRAPALKVENVYVLPGVPRIMQAIFEGFRHSLAGGRPVLSRTITASVAESIAADGLNRIQVRYPQVEIGSYPYMRNRRFGTALVVRAADRDRLDAACDEVIRHVRSLGAEPLVSDGEGTP